MLPAMWMTGLVTVLVLLPGAVRAQETASDTDSDLVDYAFAAHIGTGKYSAADRTVYVYRIPISVSPRSLTTHTWGLTLTLAGTVGFFDFDLPDIVESGFPDDVETISLVPGARFEFALRGNWLLMPFVGLGLGKNLSGGKLTYIYSTGIENRVTLATRSLGFTIGNTLLHTGQSVPEVRVSDSFVSLQTGIDVRPVVAFDLSERRIGVGPYVMNILYFSELEFLRFAEEPVRVAAQFEIGATIGTMDPEDPIEVLGIPVPRLGFGVRFGDDLRVVRVIFGKPF